jgi:hypothetical protein
MVDLFAEAGFEVAETRIVPSRGYEEWRRSACPGEVRVGHLHIADTHPEEAKEFFVYQYLIVARARKTVPARDFAENSSGFHKKFSHGVANSPLNLAINGRNEDCPPVDALRIAFLGNWFSGTEGSSLRPTSRECERRALSRASTTRPWTMIQSTTFTGARGFGQGSHVRPGA